MSEGNQYLCPILKDPVLVEHYNQLGVDLTENDLKRPVAKRWLAIYGQIFEFLTYKPIEQVIQSLFRIQRMATDCPEAHEEAFAQMAFTHCLARVLSSCGITDFNLRDIMEPTCPRVRMISSYVFNMLLHKYQREEYFKQQREKLQESKEHFETVLMRNKELKEKLAKAKARKPEVDAETLRCQEICDKHEKEFYEIKKLQEEEKRNVDELKLVTAALETEKENLKQVLSEAKLDCEKMSHKIVQSPKRFKQEQERCKEQVMILRTELHNKEQALSENKLLMEKTLNKQSAIEKAVKLCKELLAEMKNESESDAEFKKLTDYAMELKESFNSLNIQEEDVKEKLNVRKTKQHKMLSQIDISKLSFREQVNDLKQHLSRLEEQNRTVKNEIPQLQKKLENYKLEEAELKIKLQNRVTELESYCSLQFEKIYEQERNLKQNIEVLKQKLMSDEEE
ncbi:uncharacterized protein LOC131927620 [Physella acuta]|uniref:uncharacterized protein LOC131927620 n=1 Tax=Physella acuta TaxID=109671 RepID=UPI0027DD67A8|nr:uncharacterized protein LOC131927620 [Physella acuta]XP_059139316.1 uncharacterized protein LOC131927620 [Physella acuta]XP_059139317.1 uncharacterized protein LOC131927620 [Physella acuta]XP_059139318.1 uncharacterized protein LOC131927620 [Physella acuta]